MASKERVAIIGSGNWGSAIAGLVGKNVAKFSERYEQEVKIWVFDEQVVRHQSQSQTPLPRVPS